MAVLTILLVALLSVVLGLFCLGQKHLSLARLVLVFPLKVLLGEVRSCGIWNWRGLFRRQGSIPISDLKLCQKILTHPAWPDRVRSHSVMHLASFGKPIGLIFGCGETYGRARRMSSKILNHIGFHNTSRLEELVTPQVSRFLSTLEDLVNLNSNNDDRRKGTLWCPRKKLNRFVFDIVWKILFGQKRAKDDATIETFMNGLDAANQKFKTGPSASTTLNSLISQLLHPCLRIWMWYAGSRDLYGAVNEMIHERCKNPDALQDSNNFLDAYLLNLGGTKNIDMAYEELPVVLRDLLIGTGETVVSTLEFAILHIALNPSVQEKLQAEIDQVVGRSRRPLYSDRSRLERKCIIITQRASMPYTQATILEILRHGSVVSPGERVAVEDNTIHGIFYPKGTVVGIRLYEIHQSQKLWHDPKTFRPERFLSADGGRVENRGKIIPFGYGRRFCLGESLAQVVVLMFVTSLLQEFSLEIPRELPPPSLETLRGQTRSPVPYFVRVLPRI